MNEQTVTCTNTCTVTLIVTSEITTPFFALDASGGALIAGAILAVWAVGYGFRLVIRALSIDGNNQPESET